MQRIKLLYVITKLELGGAQKHLLSLIKGLDKDRFNIFLFTAKTGLLLSEALSISGLEVKKSKFLERSINPLKDLLALIEIYGFIKKNNIEIIHTHSSKAGIIGRLAARLAKIKFIIHTVHGWSFNDYQPKIFRKFYIILERFVGKLTDRFIIVSNHDKRQGIEKHIGQEDKYTLIRYGIDFDEFNKTDHNIREELGINFDELVVANVSCLKPQKSPLDFVRLAYLVTQRLSNVKFLLVGDGNLRKNIERLISRLNLQRYVVLTGWRRDIPAILSITDVLVLTSLWEGLPMAVLEAMASGCPVVATNTGGIDEIVKEGESGFLAFPRDMKNMSEKLIRLLKDEKLRKEMKKQIRLYLGGSFMFRNMLNSTQDLYESLIKKEVANAN